METWISRHGHALANQIWTLLVANLGVRDVTSAIYAAAVNERTSFAFTIFPALSWRFLFLRIVNGSMKSSRDVFIGKTNRIHLQMAAELNFDGETLHE